MILLDTNVVIYAQNQGSPFYTWSNQVIVEALAETGASVNAVTLAELCAVERVHAENVETELRKAGVRILDLPARASRICGRAYSRYRRARRKSGSGRGPRTPLPDFFIGAHAEVMGWKLATRDAERYRLYFDKLELIEPTRK